MLILPLLSILAIVAALCSLGDSTTVLLPHRAHRRSAPMRQDNKVIETCVQCLTSSCNHAEEGIQTLALTPPKSSPDLQIIFADKTKPKEAVVQVQITYVDSDKVDFRMILQQQNGTGANPNRFDQKKFIRLRFYNQYGDQGDALYFLDGYESCQGTFIGPPNVERHVLMNVAVFDRT